MLANVILVNGTEQFSPAAKRLFSLRGSFIGFGQGFKSKGFLK
jgi:hypothetical protein